LGHRRINLGFAHLQILGDSGMVKVLPGGVLCGGIAILFGGEAHNLDFLPVFSMVNRLRGLFEKILQVETSPVAIRSIALGTVTGLGDRELCFCFEVF
jgi:hypothetical protein